MAGFTVCAIHNIKIYLKAIIGEYRKPYKSGQFCKVKSIGQKRQAITSDFEKSAVMTAVSKITGNFGQKNTGRISCRIKSILFN